MKYSVIIPTMWMAYDQLIWMLQKYSDNPLIGEILIIQNAPGMPIGDTYSKVRILNNGKNLFVNPSWNLGVAEAKYDRVIIANDDITIPQIDVLLNTIDEKLQPGMLIGADSNCFAQRRTESVTKMAINAVNGDGMGYGFGVFMVLYKKDYIRIPKELKIWFGDRLLFEALIPYMFRTDIKTEMRVTTKALKNLRVFWTSENRFYNKFFKNVKKD